MKQRGLTLVEVLIALGIFSAVSAIGMAAMSIAANGSRQLEEVMDRTGEIERFRTLIRADLYLFTDRLVFEADTDRKRPSLVGGEALDEILDTRGEEPLLALVRSGWSNPGAREPRAELQAVTYLERDGDLIRRTRPYLDAVKDTPSRDEVLVSGVEDVEIAFLFEGRWEPEVGRFESTRPEAVRLRFTHPVYDEMEHIFLIGGGV
ncbi:type II secretion system minor pseudopilin GspJ [Parvularcula lutaonensis]|uniref:Type II secretion system protein J n=1 Tax=Parvularcula lutaonensis TaxID=491923 RepID=A0ABV7MDM3_9PROT|nr:type II secretion system minor pseudopilin GspJ [Parvularcula lutaonensis]GGY52727.1 type II secretion system protein J [Parvularcula lutaonensis]